MPLEGNIAGYAAYFQMGMFHKRLQPASTKILTWQTNGSQSVGLISCIRLGKKPFGKGRAILHSKLTSQSHFFGQLEPLSKILRLLIGAAGDIRCTSSPCGELRCTTVLKTCKSKSGVKQKHHHSFNATIGLSPCRANLFNRSKT